MHAHSETRTAPHFVICGVAVAPRRRRLRRRRLSLSAIDVRTRWVLVFQATWSVNEPHATTKNLLDLQILCVHDAWWRSFGQVGTRRDSPSRK